MHQQILPQPHGLKAWASLPAEKGNVMKNLRRILLTLMAACCAVSFASCSDEKKESSSSSSAETSSETSGVSGEPEFVTDPSEPDMGEYTINENGVKLYYSPEQVPAEVMAALEAYFSTYAAGDYEAYEKNIYPGYLTEMTEYLEKDFGYGMETSFNNQCETLKANAGGEFKITRIKADPAEEENYEAYFATLDELFETDFYGKVMEDADKLYDLIFYIIAEAEGEEVLLLQEFEIVFAEIDGKLYTFG